MQVGAEVVVDFDVLESLKKKKGIFNFFSLTIGVSRQ
jgi:hypothetical protein